MNNKTNYTLVGIFVIFGFMVMAFFVFWLLKPTEEMQMKKYVVYFDESVLGLNIDAPVKYRGISVGKVLKLSINPENTNQIRVLINVQKDTPITEKTVAKLTSQGITGLTYINLIENKNMEVSKITPPKDEKYPVIQSVPSLFESIQNSIGDVYTKVSRSLDRLDRLLDDKNQKEFHVLLSQSAEFFEKLNDILDQKTIHHIQSSIQHIDHITNKVDQTIPDLKKLIRASISWEKSFTASLDSITKSYLNIDKSMDGIALSMKKGEDDLHEVTNVLIPSINKSLNTLNYLLIDLQSVIKKYENNPRDIFVKESKPKLAPGEK